MVIKRVIIQNCKIEIFSILKELMTKYFKTIEYDDKKVVKYAKNCIIERIREVRIITKYEENIKNNSKKRTKNL